MNRKHALRGTRQLARKTGVPEAPSPADAELLCQTVIAFLLALLRVGYSRTTVASIIDSAFEHLPELTANAPPPPPREDFNDPGHLLTVWRSEPAYLHRGKPRPLPLRGSAPSIESLVARVDPNLDLKAAVAYLQRSKAIVKVGRRYLPSTVAVSTRGTTYQPSNQLVTLSAALLNFDHNYSAGSQWPSWYDFTSECPRFPIRKLAEFRDHVYKHATQQLQDYDDYTRRQERARRPREPTARVGVAIFQYQRQTRELSPELLKTLPDVLKSLGVPTARRRKQRPPT